MKNRFAHYGYMSRKKVLSAFNTLRSFGWFAVILIVLILYACKSWTLHVAMSVGAFVKMLFVFLTAHSWIVISILAVVIFCDIQVIPFLKKRLLHLHAKAMNKEGVLLLKPSLKSINVETNGNLEFSFITDPDKICIGLNIPENLKSSIEERDSQFLETEKGQELLKSKVAYLHRHYDEIARVVKECNIPEDVVSPAEIEYIKEHVYTFDNFVKIIADLNQKRRSNDPDVAFIGNKLGLYEYSLGRDTMYWTCYKTDHFTWRVFKGLYAIDDIPDSLKREGLADKDLYSPHKLFDRLCRRLQTHQGNEEYRNILTHMLMFLFSSLGINALVTGKNYKNQKVCLCSLRSGRIDRSRLSRIHVSIDESFSDTDMIDTNTYSVEQWLLRGIEEEIGVPIDKLTKSFKIQCEFADFSIVTGAGDYGEIGLCAIVKTEFIDSWLGYPGKDKTLESDGLFLVKIPDFASLVKILLDRRSGLQKYFARACDLPQSKYPWVEFAKPIYLRTFIRQMRFPFTIAECIRILSAFLAIATFQPVIGSLGVLGYLSYATIAYPLIPFISYYHRGYIRFSYWCPLWNGNVKTLMLTGRIINGTSDDGVNNSLYLAVESPQKQPVTLAMSDLKVIGRPLCSVRKSAAGMPGNEMPISFYNISANGQAGRPMKFFTTFYRHKADHTSLVYYVIRKKTGEDKGFHPIMYSFNFGLQEDYEICFNDKINSLKINEKSLQDYFGLYNSDLSQHRFCQSLPDKFKDRYQLYDLFQYKDSFYWSANHAGGGNINRASQTPEMNNVTLNHLMKLHGFVEKDKSLEWTRICDEKKKLLEPETGLNIGSFHASDVDNTQYTVDFILIKADSTEKFEEKLNGLMKRSLLRLGGRISELETIALQYMMIRDGIIVADFLRQNLDREKIRKSLRLLNVFSKFSDSISADEE